MLTTFHYQDNGDAIIELGDFQLRKEDENNTAFNEFRI
jgi:hypothetical protein